MDETELTRIVDAWIAGENADERSHERESHWWAIELVMDWALERQGDHLWRFILAVYKRDLSNKVKAVLAAGPLEDLLAKQGSEFIDRVEELARKDPKFNNLLGGVWQNMMSNEIWQRVQAARHQVW
jgi:hypothetical protein